MKKFLIQIRAYDYFAKFEILAHDNPKSIEQSILDKVGQKDVKWENLGNAYHDQKRITYEEVIDDTRTIHYEKVLGVRMATGTPEGGQV